MAELDVTNIPPPRVPLIDERTGLISREWYRFFVSVFNLTGVGGNPISIEDLQKNASQNGLGDVVYEIKKQAEALETAPRPELGTMASLQQDNLPWVRFDKTPQGYPTGAAAAGTVYWDDADAIKTLNIIMEDSGGVVQHIGEETYYRIKASAPITDGQVVMFTGTVGASGGLRGAPATGLTAFQNELIMGVATQNIANNGWGYVTWFGEVKGINTTGGAEAWVDGQVLYYNPAVAGGLTKNVPAAPNPKVIVASVVHAATNGILFVRPTFGSALGATDSNVEITGLANSDLLIYDGVQSRWENIPAATVVSTYAPTNYTLPPVSVTLTGSPFNYQNTNAYPIDVLVGGATGGVTNLEFSRNGTTWYGTGSFYGQFTLSPNDRLRITYTSAPTVTAIPR